MEILEHEVHEFALTRLGARWNHPDRENIDNASYLFVFDHTQFGQSIQMCCRFLCPALPDLHDAWKKSTKSNRVRKRLQSKK
jgi:hypothetical protein